MRWVARVVVVKEYQTVERKPEARKHSSQDPRRADGPVIGPLWRFWGVVDKQA